MFRLVRTPIQIKETRIIERLTPFQKFVRLKKEIESRGSKLRKFHFNAIENGKQFFVVFDGDGNEICEMERNFDSYVEVRIKCLFDIFLETAEENRQGGYTFTFRFSDEELEELINSEARKRGDMMYEIRQYLNNYPELNASEQEVDEKLFEIRQKFGIFD